MNEKIKNKELTKRKLLNAVGEIIKVQGYQGLGVNKIAKQAKVDKRLIYRYFYSLQTLLETYILEKDYWLKILNEEQIKNQTNDLETLIGTLISGQFDCFQDDEEMQGLMHWELSEKNDLLNSIVRVREDLRGEIFKSVNNDPKGNSIDLKFTSALLIAGIYYLNLHHRVNDCKFCDVDIQNLDDQKKLKKAISSILELSFQKKTKSKVECSKSI